MRPVLSTLALSIGLAAVSPPVGPHAAERDEAERASDSRTVVKAFAAALKSALVDAVTSGGPVSAIPVCNAVAPAIAEEKEADTGWSVGRTALRLRNPANAPDSWERSVLEGFLAKARQGADLAALEHYETTTLGGRRVFRYMKAIPVQQPCLTCHGSDVAPEVLAAIRQLYPDDRAIGFGPGELRGAFTIVQPVD